MNLPHIPLDQLAIMFTGVIAIFFTQSKRAWMQRAACLFGLAGQPFWLYAAVTAHQWGIVFVNAWYTVAWCKGVWVHWVRPWLAGRRLEIEFEKANGDLVVYGSATVSFTPDGNVTYVPLFKGAVVKEWPKL